jgi:hypothetical protein
VDPDPDPLLLRKSGSPGNRSRTSGYVARNPDHWIKEVVYPAYVPIIERERFLTAVPGRSVCYFLNDLAINILTLSGQNLFKK